MAKTEKNSSLLFISAFITIILAVVLLGPVADVVNQKTTLTSVSGETKNLVSAGCISIAGGGQINESDTDCTFNVANTPTGWRLLDSTCNTISSLVVKNSSGYVFVLNTDYAFTAPGQIAMKNATATRSGYANTTSLAYNYCASDYQTNSWGRTILQVGVGLLALAVLAIGVYFLYQTLGRKDED